MPPDGIEPSTFALQERCTTTVQKGLGTTDGNRTHVVRLEGEHSTTELRQLGGLAPIDYVLAIYARNITHPPQSFRALGL